MTLSPDTFPVFTLPTLPLLVAFVLCTIFPERGSQCIVTSLSANKDCLERYTRHVIVILSYCIGMCVFHERHLPLPRVLARFREGRALRTWAVAIMVLHECFMLLQAPTLAGVRTRRNRAGEKAAVSGPRFTTSQVDREVV